MNKNLIRKIPRALLSAALQSYYAGRYKKSAVKNDIVLFESKHGTDLSGNILRLMTALKDECPDKKMWLTCANKKRDCIEKILKRYGLDKVRTVSPKSLKYHRLLAEAGYLFNDTTFTSRYIKKDGQTVVNTWHGTPLKFMGKDVADSAYSMGNVERNLLFSDYLICPNEFFKEKMVSAYMLDGVYKGKLLSEGYPSNGVLFDAELREHNRKALGVKEKRVYMYMPTWRGNLTDIRADEQKKLILSYLEQLDRLMGDGEILIAKLHPFVGADMDYSRFTHIIPCPDGFETYEVLSCADCLITDYSSVFFDFLCTGRKVVLFAYDEEEYLAQRGLYIPLYELPFPKAYTADELYAHMRGDKTYDDSAFKSYDNPDAARRIIRHTVNGEKVCREESIFDSSKQNVLLYTGSLDKNGITTAAVSVLAKADKENFRYYVTFSSDSLKNEPSRTEKLPDGVRILPMPTKPQFTLAEAAAIVLYYKLNLTAGFIKKLIDRMCRRDALRFFGGVDFSCVIQYEGYGKNMIHLFRHFDCRRAIYVHNNMLEELKRKSIQHKDSLTTAYNDYDTVAVVTEDLIESTSAISGRSNNIRVIPNLHDYVSVREKAAQPLLFDEDTKCAVTAQQLCHTLEGGGLKIITVGRFSPEKGHDMLIQAFERFHADNPDSHLIIIGGYGPIYADTLALAANSPAAKSITVIRSVKNPMPIVARCDLFILPSRYEGLGLTLLEADSLGIPTASTDVCGPSGFMKANGGYLCECSAEGIEKAMRDFASGKITAMNVDYEEWNRQAVGRFEALVSGKI